jgi:hypothetical protein
VLATLSNQLRAIELALDACCFWGQASSRNMKRLSSLMYAYK